jgi:hypothetical protein
MFPFNCYDEILCCGSSVWAGIVMKHHNTPTKQATSPVLDPMTQFLKCTVIHTCIDCWALRQEFHKQNASSVPKHCAHDIASWNGLRFFFIGSTPWNAALIQALHATPMSRPLTMNVSQFHDSCIQEMDYGLDFTCGGLLDFLKHCKHTGWCVNVVWLSANCVRAFQKDRQTLHACAP